MSILSSSTLTKDHRRFLDNLERNYRCKGSSLSTPSRRGGSISFTTKISSEVIMEMKGMMEDFIIRVQKLIKEFSSLDHFVIIDIMRKNSFFVDVSILILNR
jgi:hypothetical protein